MVRLFVNNRYYNSGDLAQNATWAYRYDGFGRLAQATTADASMGEAFEYDLNANILHLERRYGGDAVQDAAMTYYGNRIASVNDASLPYYADIVPSFAAGTYTQQYDEDGRLTADGTRQITRITYTDNGAQMPQSIDFANGSRIINAYLPDGTLLQRSLRTIRTRTVVRVNAQGDTIVRTIREPIVDVTRYRGDWEINGSRWRLITPEGIALIGSAANDEGTSAGSGTGAETTFSHLWYVRDRLGSVHSVVDATGTILQNTAYYASGVPVQCFDTHRVTERGHIGNRYLDFAAIGWYDNTARMHDALLCRFTTRDPLAEKHPEHSPYLFCAANPIRFVDPDGKEWKYVDDKDSKNYNTFVWVDSKEAYDKDGKLLPGYYIQAISFSEAGEKGSFNPDSKYNIGTSTATVYKADGTTEEFNACTNPSKPDKYATVPAGRYEAKVGKHKGNYTALRMGDVGTKNFNANTIELGQSNPSNKSTTKAVGINIHKPGINNFTGIDSKNRAISMGCLLIDRKRWNDFIKIFSDYSNRIIGVIVKR